MAIVMDRFYMGVPDKDARFLNEDTMEDDDLGNEDLDFGSESESEEEEEEVNLSEPSKTAIYNADGLLDKLEDICWPKNVEWIHRLSLDIDQEKEVDVNDDLARELAFYTQALQGTRTALEALEKFQFLGLPFLRPSDCYAEMVKTDTHMEKVKGRLLSEQRKMEEAEERRKAREAKKLAKEIQAQTLKERAKQKKEEIESVKKWRKQRQKSGFAGGDKGGEMNLSFEDGKTFERSGGKKRLGVSPGDRSGGKARHGGGGGGGGGGGKGFYLKKKKDFRDSKFGFGGRKSLKKQNTAETTNDFRGFNK